MKFPPDFPMSPPTLTFLSKFWHPNVYPDGPVCISILHPPGPDAMSGELPEERWRPTQSVDSILLSVISMLGDPNFSSPANVAASVEWRNDKPAFLKRVANLIETAAKDIPSDVKIPHPDTNPVERQLQLDRMKALHEEAFCLYDDRGFSDYDDDEIFGSANDADEWFGSGSGSESGSDPDL